jgi:hypothetical protein
LSGDLQPSTAATLQPPSFPTDYHFHGRSLFRFSLRFLVVEIAQKRGIGLPDESRNVGQSSNT